MRIKIMFAKLKIKLDDNTLDYTKSSMFQGILFEKIDTEYADYDVIDNYEVFKGNFKIN